MSDASRDWTTGRAVMVIFVGVLLALIANDMLNGLIEGFRAAFSN